MKKIPKPIQLLIKVAVTVACLWYVSGKIDFVKAGNALQHANWLYLLAALLFFAVSKIISSFRLSIYFRNINIRLSDWQGLKLYWLGMFYNLFLPGSISGDAYKVILLTRKFSVPYKKTTAAVLLDRLSGLLGLSWVLAIYGVFVLDRSIYSAALVAGALLASATLWWMLRYWFKDFRSSFFSTLLLGILVQLSQVICIYFIFSALGISGHLTEYVFIFLISSVAAVLPLTIGGLGIREVVFLEGSRYFGLVQENSVIISILFYLVTLIISVMGIFYVYKDPLKINKDPGIGP